MRSNLLARASGVVLVLAASAAIGCNKHQAFVVLTLVSGDQAITNVGSVVVTVSGSGPTAPVTLTYPAGKMLTIGTAGSTVNPPVTLAVSFSNENSGNVALSVEVDDAAHCRVATGSTAATVNKDAVSNATVTLSSTPLVCPSDGGADGSAGDTGETAPFPGCDPTMASTCGDGKTCFVDCTAGQGLCVAAGPSGPGQLCPDNNSACVQGTQCFDYSPTEPGCNVQACLKFCKTDMDCTSGTGVGLGQGSVCAGPVQCTLQGGTVRDTGYRTCTFACDPRGTAKTNCPTGLACFLVDELDQVDCRCVPAASVKAEGQTCATFQDCAPGLICTTMGATAPKTCRRICKSGSAGDCATGQSCAMLSNDKVYGICL